MFFAFENAGNFLFLFEKVLSCLSSFVVRIVLTQLLIDHSLVVEFQRLIHPQHQFSTLLCLVRRLEILLLLFIRGLDVLVLLKQLKF